MSDLKSSSEEIKKTLKDAATTAKKSLAIGAYNSGTDKELGRSKEQARYMRATRRRNFSSKMGTIDPGYNKKAAGILAAGTVLGLAATAVPAVGAALGPALGGAIIASGLAALEVNAHRRVGDHAVLDTLLADQGEDAKQWASENTVSNVDRNFGFDDLEWDDYDDGEDDYADDHNFDEEFDQASLGQYYHHQQQTKSPIQQLSQSGLHTVPIPNTLSTSSAGIQNQADLFGELVHTSSSSSSSSSSGSCVASSAPMISIQDEDPFAELFNRKTPNTSSSTTVHLSPQPASGLSTFPPSSQQALANHPLSLTSLPTTFSSSSSIPAGGSAISNSAPIISIANQLGALGLTEQPSQPLFSSPVTHGSFPGYVVGGSPSTFQSQGAASILQPSPGLLQPQMSATTNLAMSHSLLQPTSVLEPAKDYSAFKNFF